MKSLDNTEKFKTELRQLLDKYNAEISLENKSFDYQPDYFVEFYLSPIVDSEGNILQQSSTFTLRQL